MTTDGAIPCFALFQALADTLVIIKLAEYFIKRCINEKNKKKLV